MICSDGSVVIQASGFALVDGKLEMFLRARELARAMLVLNGLQPMSLDDRLRENPWGL